MTDKFDIAFSFDTTGSMYCYLEEVRRRLREMVQDLKTKIPSIKIAIFAHGDYCDEGSSYVTKCIDFTDDVNRLCNFVRDVEGTGGGDAPECYELVMREVQEKLTWRPDAQKALVMIGDAPPHEASEDQNYRHLDWKEETVRLRNLGIKIYSVQCNMFSYCEEFYQHIASQTFGYHNPLEDMTDVEDMLMRICFREAGIEGCSSTPTSIPTLSPETETYVSSDEEGELEGDLELFATKCCHCNVLKISDEYPPAPLTDECEHYAGVCLRCVVKHVHEKNVCPQCGVAVEPEGKQMQWFEAVLDYKFLDYAKVIAKNRMSSFKDKDMITVSTLTGETVWVEFRPDMTVAELKKEVEKELKIDPNSQKILFNDQGLKANSSLTQYGITKNTALHVIVPLYCVPDNLDHVVFDLSWRFPKNNPDFLDASCMAFSGTRFVQLIDWNHPSNAYYLKEAVRHSEKLEKKAGGLGHQKIEVFLKRLPGTVDHLYFILSSWRSPDLSAFSSPSLQFYEASSPDSDLCSTTFSHALHSQAVIMVSLDRVDGKWQINECDTGGLVDGNAKKYEPIRAQIETLIKNARMY